MELLKKDEIPKDTVIDEVNSPMHNDEADVNDATAVTSEVVKKVKIPVMLKKKLIYKKLQNHKIIPNKQLQNHLRITNNLQITLKH